MPSRRNTRLKLVECLLVRATEAWSTPSRRMPGVRELAVEFGCASATVVGALREIRARGIIETAPRRGIRVIADPSEQTAQLVPRDTLLPGASVVERTANAILADIVYGGVASDGRVPGRKELSARYGVSPRSAVMAVRRLCENGFLDRAGRQYTVRRFRSEPSRLSVHAILIGDNRGEIGDQTPHQLRLVHALEEDLRRRDLRFRAHILPRRFGRPQLPVSDERELIDEIEKRSLGGVIIMTVYTQLSILTHLRRLLPGGVRVALLDDGGVLGGSAAERYPAEWKAFSVAQGPLAGEIVGNYLIRLGHRRVAWLSASDDSPWSSARRRGIESAYRAAGVDFRCTAFVADPPGAAPQSGRDEELYRRISQAAAQLSFAPQRGNLPLGILEEHLTAVLNRRANYVELRRRLLRPMQEALRDESVSAWVADNDSAAIVCLEFLREYAVAVPGRISVIGFDDSQAALRAGLTSYSFNPWALSNAMVTWVMDPALAYRQWPKPEVSEVAGFIRERLTAGLLLHRSPEHTAHGTPAH